jgi:hypothetical protein
LDAQRWVRIGLDWIARFLLSVSGKEIVSQFSFHTGWVVEPSSPPFGKSVSSCGLFGFLLDSVVVLINKLLLFSQLRERDAISKAHWGPTSIDDEIAIIFFNLFLKFWLVVVYSQRF